MKNRLSKLSTIIVLGCTFLLACGDILTSSGGVRAAAQEYGSAGVVVTDTESPVRIALENSFLFKSSILLHNTSVKIDYRAHKILKINVISV